MNAKICAVAELGECPVAENQQVNGTFRELTPTGEMPGTVQRGLGFKSGTPAGRGNIELAQYVAAVATGSLRSWHCAAAKRWVCRIFVARADCADPRAGRGQAGWAVGGVRHAGRPGVQLLSVFPGGKLG